MSSDWLKVPESLLRKVLRNLRRHFLGFPVICRFLRLFFLLSSLFVLKFYPQEFLLRLSFYKDE